MKSYHTTSNPDRINAPTSGGSYVDKVLEILKTATQVNAEQTELEAVRNERDEAFRIASFRQRIIDEKYEVIDRLRAEVGTAASRFDAQAKDLDFLRRHASLLQSDNDDVTTALRNAEGRIRGLERSLQSVHEANTSLCRRVEELAVERNAFSRLVRLFCDSELSDWIASRVRARAEEHAHKFRKYIVT